MEADERGQRGDVDDAAAAARHHRPAKHAARLKGGGEVGVHDPAPRLVVCSSVGPGYVVGSSARLGRHAGGIDQNVDGADFGGTHVAKPHERGLVSGVDADPQ